MIDTTNDFNIYYLNFSKVYEMAMIINNKIVKTYQKETGQSEEVAYSNNVGIDLSLGNDFLSSVKSSISSGDIERKITNARVVESIEIKTTKSILLRRILPFCKVIKNITDDVKEGDLIKLENIQLQLFDEESLRQFLVLKRDALKGFRVEGMEVNNIVSSLLQDYSYVLIGYLEKNGRILIKIPMESQTEFENKYKVDDILIGKVSIVGIYKGKVSKETITASTFSFFQDKGSNNTQKRIIKSNNHNTEVDLRSIEYLEEDYNYLDVLAIIQDVAFEKEDLPPNLHWWNKIGIWLAGIGRKNRHGENTNL